MLTGLVRETRHIMGGKNIVFAAWRDLANFDARVKVGFFLPRMRQSYRAWHFSARKSAFHRHLPFRAAETNFLRHEWRKSLYCLVPGTKVPGFITTPHPRWGFLHRH
jgi:hypothetical protein